MGHFYLAIVQAILLFGAETWVVTPHIGQLLRGFHHRVERRILGKQPRQREERNWEYPPTGEIYTGSKVGRYVDLHLLAP